jgi:hypothetical protein
VRDQRYRLDAAGRLFDMIEDPSQQHDVAQRETETARKLREAAHTWKQSVLSSEGNPKLPHWIAHPAVSWSRLPADDARTSGSIRRSSVHPNCSYFTHWTSPEDRITWDVDVLTAGRYEVEILYACPASDTGSRIEVSMGEHRISGRITTAHDPPLRGHDLERIPRSESYTKQFRPMSLGVLRMEKGVNRLTMRATEIPGKQVMEFRGLTLKRTE